MALSDHVAFDDIYAQFGLNEVLLKKSCEITLNFLHIKPGAKE